MPQPTPAGTLAVGDRVHAASNDVHPDRGSGVVTDLFADGKIARVRWDDLTRRGDREAGENPRKRYPYISDIGASMLVREA